MGLILLALPFASSYVCSPDCIIAILKCVRSFYFVHRFYLFFFLGYIIKTFYFFVVDKISELQHLCDSNSLYNLFLRYKRIQGAQYVCSV